MPGWLQAGVLPPPQPDQVNSGNFLNAYKQGPIAGQGGFVSAWKNHQAQSAQTQQSVQDSSDLFDKYLQGGLNSVPSNPVALPGETPTDPTTGRPTLMTQTPGLK